MRTLLLALAVLSSVSMTVYAAPVADDGDGLSPPALESSVTKPGKVAESATDRPTEKVADKVDFERESLARIAHELVALKVQVEDAARAAPTMARVQFRYDWLTTDLDLIERAIREHLDAPRQPRAIVPLKGDYRR
jgi:RAQPRD family integrative conjugative element protein